MALIHWWPLNGDTKDYGLNPTGTITGTATFSNNGKIGKCLVSSNEVKFTCSDISGKVWSIAWWGYVVSSSVVNNWTGQLQLTDGSSNIRFEVCPTTYSNGRYCYSIHNNPGNAIFSGSIASPTGKYDKWVHIVLTCDGTKLVKYIDGVNAGSISYSGSGKLNGNIRLLNNQITYKNDIRFYNHVLSQKEIKELGKGLVLHYDFEDEEIEGTTNRINSSSPFSSCYNGATGKYGWGSNTDMYKEYGIFQGKQCTKVRMGTVNLSAWPFPFFESVNPYSTTSNTYCTLSFDYYPTSITSMLPYSFKSGVQINSYLNGVDMNGATITNIPLNQWSHIVIIYKRTNDDYDGDGCGYVRIGTSAHTSTTTDYWLFANVQSEYKDHETPFVNGTRSTGTVYDCSGNGYDLTINNGSVQILKDSSIGIHSIFSPAGANYVERQNTTLNCLNHQEFTVNCWIKILGYIGTRWNTIFRLSADNTKDTQLHLCYNSSGKIILSQYSDDPQFDTTLSLNTWGMLTWVHYKDGSTAKCRYYVNGVQVGSDTAYSGLLNISANPRLTLFYDSLRSGYDASLYIGDFKIYATALSASDIQREYQAMANVDKAYNLTTKVFVEDPNRSTFALLDKSGTFNCKEIEEIPNLPGYTLLKYIESTAAQDIDTGIVMYGHSNDIEVSGLFTTISTTNVYLIGEETVTNKRGINIWMRSGENKLRYSIGNLTSYVTPSLALNTEFIAKVVQDGPLITTYFNGEIVHSTSTFDVSTLSQTSEKIFYSRSDNSSQGTKRIYHMKMWQDGTLVRNFIPVQRNSDSEIGLYDLVNGVFYTNSGTGTFTAGPALQTNDLCFKTYDDGKLVAKTFNEN